MRARTHAHLENRGEAELSAVAIEKLVMILPIKLYFFSTWIYSNRNRAQLSHSVGLISEFPWKLQMFKSLTRKKGKTATLSYRGEKYEVLTICTGKYLRWAWPGCSYSATGWLFSQEAWDTEVVRKAQPLGCSVDLSITEKSLMLFCLFLTQAQLAQVGI